MMELQKVNDLVRIENNQIVTSSRQVAETFHKQHRHVLRDIRSIMQGVSNFGHTPSPPMFYETKYLNQQNGQEYPEYLMNRDGFSLLVMGFTGKEAMQWKIKYIQAFNEMEAELNRRNNNLPDFSNPVEAARAWADVMEAHQKAVAQIEADKPKVLFANSIEISDTSIAIGDMSKLLKQKGVDIGRNRLFQWMRENGYLIKQKCDEYNMPTQYAMDHGWFEIKESTYMTTYGSVVTKTPKVTGKGQVYFINKFLNDIA